MNKTVMPKTRVYGTLKVPGDKSISHRAIMFGSISKGRTVIEGFLTGEDCMATIECFKKMGVNIYFEDDKVIVEGNGLHGLKAPAEILDVGNSGTTIRLILGILAPQEFETRITGDASIQKRPMDRVLIPLRQMGALCGGRENGRFAPLEIKGNQLEGIDYTLPVASAQVKSAILLASLYAKGITRITEPAPTRDHTEIMLNYFGADIKKDGNVISSRPVKELTGKKVVVPGDISSAAYFIVAGLILENAHLIIENVGMNPTRTGIITALCEMGGEINILNKRSDYGEEVADIEVKSSKLKAITLKGDIIPTMIDEIPVFAVAALFAEGTTVIEDAQELKVKESNRIQTVASELGKMGAVVTETDDGMIIKGGQSLKGAEVETYTDHRIAMTMGIAALKAEGATTILGAHCCDVSFPGFFELLESL